MKMIKFNDQSERNKTGQYGFLAAVTTGEKHEDKTKNQRSSNKQS